MESKMAKLTMASDNRVKRTFFTDGYFHIDLFDGMRLSGPVKADEDGCAPASRLVETGPSADWDPDMSLERLMS
jgi:hypothetical protein